MLPCLRILQQLLLLKLSVQKKGEPFIIAPQNDSQKWSIKSSWVAEDDLVKVQFCEFYRKRNKNFGKRL